MPGPAPSHKDQRRRRNRPVSGEWVVLPKEHDREVPELPKIAGHRWKKSTRDWWIGIWKSPMGSQWQDADIEGLAQLAFFKQLHDATDRLDEKLKLADRMEKRMNLYGLTPKGRRDLRWVVTEEDAESAGIDRPLAVVRRLPAK